MKKLASCLALSVLLGACDPEIRQDLVVSAVTQRIATPSVKKFGLDSASLALSPIADIDPNSDCSFVEGVTSAGIARFLQQKPSELCKGRPYRTCSMTSITSVSSLDLLSSVSLVVSVGWKQAKTRAETLHIEALAVRDGSVAPAGQPIIADSTGQLTEIEQSLPAWKGASAIALVVRVMTPCDGTPESLTGESEMTLARAELHIM